MRKVPIILGFVVSIGTILVTVLWPWDGIAVRQIGKDRYQVFTDMPPAWWMLVLAGSAIFLLFCGWVDAKLNRSALEQAASAEAEKGTP